MASEVDVAGLAAGVLASDRRAVARAITTYDSRVSGEVAARVRR